MLAHIGVLSAQDLADIERAWRHPRRDRARPLRLAAGARRRAPEHRAAADRTRRRGGKRLHTGRSRNDQVATDLRLWLRSAIDAIAASLAAVQRSLIAQADVHADTVMRLHTPAGGRSR